MSIWSFRCDRCACSVEDRCRSSRIYTAASRFLAWSKVDLDIIVLMQDGFLGASTPSLEVFIVVLVIEFTLEVFLLAPEFLAFVTISVLHPKQTTKPCHEHHVYVIKHVIKCVDQFLVI